MSVVVVMLLCLGSAIAGATLGIVAMALCVMARRADDSEPRL